MGEGANTGLLSSPFYNEDKSRPYGGNYHDITACASNRAAYGTLAAPCGDTGLWAGLETDGAGTATDDGNASV